MSVLTIHSRVSRGHVGNAAAVPLLQALGSDVWAVDTVRLSHHPGYSAQGKSPAGGVLPAEDVKADLDAVLDLGALGECHGVLSGYLGTAVTGRHALDAIARIKAESRAALYVCDPVMGDTAEGLYVADELVAFFREEALPQADVATPNAFELGLLVGRPIETIEGAIQAADALIARGTKALVVTSVPTGGRGVTTLSASQAGLHVVCTPELERQAKGVGDALAALVTGYLLAGKPVEQAMADAVACVHVLLEMTPGASLDLQLAGALGAVFRAQGKLQPYPVVRPDETPPGATDQTAANDDADDRPPASPILS